jgi:glycosyltransferase involved in cell wall biosynthesis
VTATPPDRPIAVAHVITGLLVGGAETALARLLETLPRRQFPALVISLLPEGPVAARIRSAGCEVVSLGMRRGMPTPGALLTLRRALRAFRPDVMQGWMYHGNLAAWIGAGFLPRGTPVAWNIRQTLYDLRHERPGTRLVIRAGALFSGRVAAIVYNSEVARAQHTAMGYRSSQGIVIPNGFDLEVFRPSPEARVSLREELGLPQSRLVVGLVNRYHPMKGHATFLQAARLVLDAGVEATFVCAGRDVTFANPELGSLVNRLGLGDHVRLLGERSDTPRLFAGFDVACMASAWGEGFPNVVGEAMACGTPCVATGVGDTATVIGDSGRIVPADDPGAVAAAINGLLRLDAEARGRLGSEARSRIGHQYALRTMSSRYADLYRSLAAGAGSVVVPTIGTRPGGIGADA